VNLTLPKALHSSKDFPNSEKKVIK